MFDVKPRTRDRIICDGCEADFNSEAILIFYGNVNLGNEGGLVGNNFADDGKPVRALSYCGSCAYDILFEKTSLKHPPRINHR